MATNKNLPCVVLSNDKFRIVAREKTKQAPSVHAMHMVVDLNDDDDNRECVDLFAEMKHIDSMGSESWSGCNLEVAKNDIVATQVRTNMLDLQKTIQNETSKSAKQKVK